MNQEVAIQAFLSRYKNPRTLEILKSNIKTSRGRNKIAASMIHPVKLACDYLEETSKSWGDIGYITEGHVIEYNRFMATVPEEEQTADPFPELKSLVDNLQARIDMVKRRSTTKTE